MLLLQKLYQKKKRNHRTFATLLRHLIPDHSVFLKESVMIQ